MSSKRSRGTSNSSSSGSSNKKDRKEASGKRSLSDIPSPRGRSSNDQQPWDTNSSGTSVCVFDKRFTKSTTQPLPFQQQPTDLSCGTSAVTSLATAISATNNNTCFPFPLAQTSLASVDQLQLLMMQTLTHLQNENMQLKTDLESANRRIKDGHETLQLGIKKVHDMKEKNRELSAETHQLKSEKQKLTTSLNDHKWKCEFYRRQLNSKKESAEKLMQEKVALELHSKVVENKLESTKTEVEKLKSQLAMVADSMNSDSSIKDRIVERNDSADSDNKHKLLLENEAREAISRWKQELVNKFEIEVENRFMKLIEEQSTSMLKSLKGMVGEIVANTELNNCSSVVATVGQAANDTSKNKAFTETKMLQKEIRNEVELFLRSNSIFFEMEDSVALIQDAMSELHEEPHSEESTLTAGSSD